MSIERPTRLGKWQKETVKTVQLLDYISKLTDDILDPNNANGSTDTPKLGVFS